MLAGNMSKPRPSVVIAALCAVALGAWALQAQAPAKQPVTTMPGPAGDQLRLWAQQGTAAGNVGDYYDNRDGDHSPLDMKLFPQLQRFVYSEDERKNRRDWAAQTRVLPHVVVGNSSTAGPAEQGGSNARRLYTDPRGLALLHEQYTHNNLYVYPEHQDHDPGRNGPAGYGDLFPTNTPYVIISQGSSYTDQPFLRAAVMTMASFQPATKKRLVESELLMPAVQMIFRYTNKHLASKDEYLTGKAHPTVFDGQWVDEAAMSKMAHEMKVDAVPPLVKLRVIGEDVGRDGKEFFEGGATERLGLVDTPSVIARVWRSVARTRRMVVSAEGSTDANNKPLKFHWKVLRGDEKQVTIRPLNPAGTVAEIVIPYPERRPVWPGSPIESNRLDIGVFAHNGAYHSPPAFVTFFGIDSEARTYTEDGKAVEVGYGFGEPGLNVSNWAAFFEALRQPKASPGVKLLTSKLKPAELTALNDVGKRYAAAAAAPGAKPEQAEAVLNAAVPALKKPAREFVQALLREVADDPELWKKNAAAVREAVGDDPGRRHMVSGLRRQLVMWGVLADGKDDAFELTPARKGPGAAAQRMTAYERMLIRRVNAELIGALLLPGRVEASFKTNYVDPQLAAAKSWRDVYDYDARGQLAGWRRYDANGVSTFNAEGHLVLEQDKLGRCVKARAVRYNSEPGVGQTQRAVKTTLSDSVVYYAYTNSDDRRGKAVMTRKYEREEPAGGLQRSGFFGGDQ